MVLSAYRGIDPAEKGIDPAEKRIRTYHPRMLQGLCVVFTLLAAVRFYTVRQRLSDEDEGTF